MLHLIQKPQRLNAKYPILLISPQADVTTKVSEYENKITEMTYLAIWLARNTRATGIP